MENRLKIFRTQRNYSQAALAERLGVSRQTINSIEKGKYDPSLPLAMKIAELFDCAIETIFIFEPDSESGSTGGSMLDKLMKKASEVIALTQGGFTFEKLTPQAVKVVMLAQDETLLLKHNFVGTEQILLGLIAEENGIAAKVLKSAGLTLDKTRVEVEKIIGRGSSFIEIQIPFTPRVKRVFEFALEQAHQFGTNHVDTEHLLLGLLLEGNGVAVRVLNVLRVDINHLRQKVIEEIASEKVQISAFKASTNENIFDFTSGAISARFCNFLSSWIESHELGYIVTNTGFRLSSGDLYAPHIAFYSKEKLKQIPRIYPELSPDLIVEIKTAFEQLNTIQTKISNFLEMGIGSAILINPDERTVSVSVYKSDNKHNVNLFHDGDKLTLPDLFPGWELEVSELWVN